jgi:hypothetical protein
MHLEAVFQHLESTIANSSLAPRSMPIEFKLSHSGTTSCRDGWNRMQYEYYECVYGHKKIPGIESVGLPHVIMLVSVNEIVSIVNVYRIEHVEGALATLVNSFCNINCNSEDGCLLKTLK